MLWPRVSLRSQLLRGPGMALPVGWRTRTQNCIVENLFFLKTDPYPAPACPFINDVNFQIAFAFFCI